MGNFLARHHFFSTEAVLSDSVGQGVEMLNEMMAAVAVFKIYTFSEKVEVLSRAPCPAPYLAW